MQVNREDKIVQMYHPGLQQTATTTVSAFDALWRLKSWVLVSASSHFAGEVLGQVVPAVEDLTVAQLQTVITRQGLAATGTKTELLDIIDALTGGNAVGVVLTPEPDHRNYYDPADHTVAEVLTYLDSGVSTWERDRVVEAERIGGGRKGIMDRGTS